MKIKIALLSLLLLGGAALWIPKGPALPPGLTFAQINNPSSGGSGTPGGSSGQVQYNSSGSFAGDAGLAYNSTTKALGVIGTIISGQAGTQNGELDLNGTTSGTAKFTAPAVAGTVTNPIASSNAMSFPDPGGASVPTGHV